MEDVQIKYTTQKGAQKVHKEGREKTSLKSSGRQNWNNVVGNGHGARNAKGQTIYFVFKTRTARSVPTRLVGILLEEFI